MFEQIPRSYVMQRPGPDHMLRVTGKKQTNRKYYNKEKWRSYFGRIWIDTNSEW